MFILLMISCKKYSFLTQHDDITTTVPHYFIHIPSEIVAKASMITTFQTSMTKEDVTKVS